MAETATVPRTRRVPRYTLAQMVVSLERELVEQRSELITLTSRLHIVRLKVGVALTYVDSIKEIMTPRRRGANGHQ